MKPTTLTNPLTTIATAAVAMAILTSTAATATAVPAPPPSGGHRQASVALVLQRDADSLLRQGAPGVLAQVQTQRSELTVRSGAADTRTGRPVPFEARFRIGSQTKTFVSATVLQMVGEGKLSLDDTVETWLPGLVRGHGNDGREITVRQLLQHTSGLPEFLQGLTYLFSQEGFQKHRYDTLTPRQAVLTAMKFKPDFAPGTSWNYSNTNYVLVGMIIAKVSGHTWQHEVRRRIIKPLGLRSTTLPNTRVGIPGPHAVGYERFPGPNATPQDPDYGEPIDATRLNPSWGGAAGEIISTTHDTNTFLRALVSGQVLRPTQLAQMQHTVATNKAFRSYLPGARYGLGLMRIRNSCGHYWSHGGDIQGFQTRNGVTPNGKRSVTVSINTDTFVRDPGAPAPKQDISNDLIDHALCGA
jgi:D-alanyl-D-alanine carboxypeptidase